jgi:hypothetical protein
MFPKSDPNLRVLLPGLSADVAESLGQTVSESGTIFYVPHLSPLLRSLRLIRKAAPDLVFVWTGENPGAFVLEAVTRAEPQVTAVASETITQTEKLPIVLNAGYKATNASVLGLAGNAPAYRGRAFGAAGYGGSEFGLIGRLRGRRSACQRD